ncbi:MAG: hypothetical protein ABEJ57_06405 [Halobacteriaceae archaeon]
MVATIYSTLLMGALVLFVAVWLARGRDWRAYKPERFTGLIDRGGDRSSMDPITAFFLLLVASTALGAATVFALGTTDPVITTGAFFAPLVLSYLAAGVYVASKGRTGSSAGAAATTAIVLFTVALLAIVVKLLAGI